jgi:hypothetical protein
LDFMKSATMDLDWPKLAIVKDPTLFRRITCNDTKRRGGGGGGGVKEGGGRVRRELQS